VKILIDELKGSTGVAHVPDSHATRRILSVMYGRSLLDKKIVSDRLLKRTLVLSDLELMAAVRVGEACEGTGCHGALSNNLCLMRDVGTDPGDPSETCELYIADSKTAYPRYANFMGRSSGIGIESARHIRELWQEMGIKIDEKIEDGLIVERPDYWVVRISMADMNKDEYKRFRTAVANCTEVAEVARQSKATLLKSKERREAETRGEEAKYVNVAGGAKDSETIKKTLKYFKSKGLGKFLDVVPGPLLRATHGYTLTHMPLKTDSSYKHLIGALKAAWEISNEMEDPDLELDLEGLEKPKWAHHSFRRTADMMARRSMKETGVTKEDIDDMFGWKQAERAKDMQVHYDVRRHRARRAAITMMI
jgi:hypothetical protein